MQVLLMPPHTYQEPPQSRPAHPPPAAPPGPASSTLRSQARALACWRMPCPTQLTLIKADSRGAGSRRVFARAAWCPNRRAARAIWTRQINGRPLPCTSFLQFILLCRAPHAAMRLLPALALAGLLVMACSAGATAQIIVPNTTGTTLAGHTFGSNVGSKCGLGLAALPPHACMRAASARRASHVDPACFAACAPSPCLPLHGRCMRTACHKRTPTLQLPPAGAAAAPLTRAAPPPLCLFPPPPAGYTLFPRDVCDIAAALSGPNPDFTAAMGIWANGKNAPSRNGGARPLRGARRAGRWWAPPSLCRLAAPTATSLLFPAPGFGLTYYTKPFAFRNIYIKFYNNPNFTDATMNAALAYTPASTAAEVVAHAAGAAAALPAAGLPASSATPSAAAQPTPPARPRRCLQALKRIPQGMVLYNFLVRCSCGRRRGAARGAAAPLLHRPLAPRPVTHARLPCRPARPPAVRPRCTRPRRA